MSSFSRVFYMFLLIPVLFLACKDDGTSKIVKVGEIMEISGLQGNYFKPRLSPDGKMLLVTNQNDQGLVLYNLETNTKKVISRVSDVGKVAGFTPYGNKVYYISNSIFQNRRVKSLVVQDIETNERIAVVGDARSIYMLQGDLKENSLYFLNDGEVNRYSLDDMRLYTYKETASGAYADPGMKLNVFHEGEKRILSPAGVGRHMWVSMSPDKQRVVFTKVGAGSFTCDLSGGNVVELGDVRAPKWSPNGQYIVAMADKDDGDRFTSSDIILISKDGLQRQNLTEKSDIIAMYPDIAQDGSMIVFSDENGNCYVMRLN